MFTGLIERTGTVFAVNPAAGGAPARLWVEVGEGFPAAHGDSIAVNGCCLTVVAQRDNQYAFDVSSETLACTTFGVMLSTAIFNGSKINLERALRAGDRLGGHLVSGHVDGTAKVLALDSNATGWLFRIEISRSMARLVIPKGSICVDGVSLTVNAIKDFAAHSVVEMMLIPTTLQLTNLAARNPGDLVNVELDMMAKFAARQQETRDWA
ncbi:MAG: hypothetical protein RIQ81_782 [Pseudomonadota bacterium]|jgi:riboflavin synthase